MPSVIHSNLSGTDLHEDKRIKAPVTVASTANVSLSAPGSTLDGVTLSSGNRILLKNQSTSSQNGIYVWTGASVALTRATDADSASDFTLGFMVYVSAGTSNVNTVWLLSQSAAITLETTAITFVGLGTVGPIGLIGPTGLTGPTGPVGPVGPGGAPYVCLQDRKVLGTDGGTATSGSDQTRTLNTIRANDNNMAVLNASNQFTLPAGLFRYSVSAPGHQVDRHQVLLYDVTAAMVVDRGTSEFAGSSTVNGANRSVMTGRIGITSPRTFEIRHRVQTTVSTNGFGVAGSFGTEIYTIAEFWLEGLPPPFFGTTDPNPTLGTTMNARGQVARHAHVQHSLNTPPQ